MHTPEKRLHFSQIDLEIAATILNAYWGTQIYATPDMVQERFSGKQLFIFKYDSPTKNDKEYFSENGIKLKNNKKYIVGILETMAIYTGGDLDNMPRTYEEATGEGLFKRVIREIDYETNSKGILVPRKPDTLVPVDVSVSRTRTGKRSNGEGPSMIEEAKQKAPELPYKYIFTFTPLMLAVQGWHHGLEAEYTDYVIENARSKLEMKKVLPGDNPKHVGPMDYSRFAA